VAAAVEAIRNGEVRRIVLVRPAVEAGEKLGFLPGDFQAKVNPYLRPLYDALHDLIDPGARQRYLESDLIEVCPLAYMRGRTLNHAFVILDEAQNCTVPQMLMFLTRMGEGSRMVVTGDPSQVDLPPHARSGLADAVRRLEGVEGIAIARLLPSDIVRHRVVQDIIAAYESAVR
jgi:phosphate starvation-inducible PhoH-like protein